jgi:signal transduction histidine kinase
MNESLFSWVIENLTKNAVDAMNGQGNITFRVSEKGSKVRLDITDTGRGIPKSKFKTIFHPGYTTRARGWGLGLSLVKRIVESYPGGRIFVKNSEPGKGATFRIEMRKYCKPL